MALLLALREEMRPMDGVACGQKSVKICVENLRK